MGQFGERVMQSGGPVQPGELDSVLEQQSNSAARGKGVSHLNSDPWSETIEP